MARLAPPLDTGDGFPELAFDTVAHGRVTLPAAMTARRGVVLVVRAHW